MNKLLITRPNHDPTTNYLFHWSKPILKQARKSGVEVIDLQGKRANANEFASVVKKTHPKFIFINGHGDHSTVTGFDNEPLVKAKKNQVLFDNRLVFTRSCQSAKTLGPESIKSGCISYVGYNDDFVFVVEDEKTSRPLEDNTAKLFLEPSNHVAISILKGHSVGVSNQKSKDFYKRNIQRLSTSSATKEDSELVPFLVWDYLHQVCLGDENASFI